MPIENICLGKKYVTTTKKKKKICTQDFILIMFAEAKIYGEHLLIFFLHREISIFLLIILNFITSIIQKNEYF